MKMITMLCTGSKLMVMVLPLLVHTQEWNTECPLKPTGSTPPPNSKVRCTVSGGCKVTCNRGYTFPLGERHIFYKCRDGSWHLEGGDPKYYKECIPFCKPACMNGGHCIAPHTCQCTEGWHGRACRRAPIGTVSCSPPCENGGFCIMNNTCECLEGYTGHTCHHAVKFVTTSIRPIEYDTSIIKQPVEIPAVIPDKTTTTIDIATTDPTTTTTTTAPTSTESTTTASTTTASTTKEPTTTELTTTESTTAEPTETTSSTSTTIITSSTISPMIAQVLDSNSSITTSPSPVTQVDSSLDTEASPPTFSSIASETVIQDRLESVLENKEDSRHTNDGHRSVELGYNESRFEVDDENPSSDRLDATENRDYEELDASTQRGCSCSVPWPVQTAVIVLLIFIMK